MDKSFGSCNPRGLMQQLGKLLDGVMLVTYQVKYKE